MKNYFSSPLKQISIGLILALGSTGVWAQTSANYPDKPVKVIIPFPPGGTLDKIGRMLAETPWTIKLKSTVGPLINEH